MTWEEPLTLLDEARASMDPPDFRTPEGLAEAFEARDRAIEKAGTGAPVDWIADALTKLHGLAVLQPELTADDLQAICPSPPEPRAFGAVFKTAKTRGWMRPTDRTVPSARVVNHGRPVRVWQSLRYRGQA